MQLLKYSPLSSWVINFHDKDTLMEKSPKSPHLQAEKLGLDN